MDRSTARSLVSLKIEDPSRTQFTDDQYNQAIDLAEEHFAIDARALIKETTLTSVEGTAEIALPTDCLIAILVRHSGLKLRPVTKYELSFQAGDDWSTKRGTPKGFYIDEEDETLGLVPIPEAADAGANVLLNYIAAPAAISSDSQLLLNQKALLQYYTPAIVAWAAREMLTYKSMTDDNIRKMGVLLKEYERYREECVVTYKNMADEPLQMRGGRDWADQVMRSNNAFSD